MLRHTIKYFLSHLADLPKLFLFDQWQCSSSDESAPTDTADDS